MIAEEAEVKLLYLNPSVNKNGLRKRLFKYIKKKHALSGSFKSVVAGNVI